MAMVEGLTCQMFGKEKFMATGDFNQPVMLV